LIDDDDPFKELSIEYLLALPARVEEIKVAITRGRSGDASAVDEARNLAHRLRGTAGSFGVPEIGRLSGAIEDALARRDLGPGLDATIRELEDAARTAGTRG
jgi:HPt (histidine-containing phosphotransfer) domain-containing protein